MNFTPLKDFLDYYMPMLGIPGSDTVIYKRHEEIFRHQSGIDSRRLRTPIQKDALYNVYSCSGAVTCIAAMQLVERGEMLVTDPLYAYIPEYRDVAVGVKSSEGVIDLANPSQPITIKQLFTMTSGICDSSDHPAVKSAIDATSGQAGTVEIVKSFAKIPLVAHPGAMFVSGLSHDVLGAVVEIVSGQKLSDYVQKNIFEPLGMKDSSFRTDSSSYSRFASQYTLDNVLHDAIEMPSYKCDMKLGAQYESGGFGITSTVDDFAIFVDALACGGVSKCGERIISEYALDVMTKNALEAADLNKRSLGTKAGYGFGYGFNVNMSPETYGNLAPVGEFFVDGEKNTFFSCDRDSGVSIFHTQNLSDLNRIVIPRIRNLLFSCLGEKG